MTIYSLSIKEPSSSASAVPQLLFDLATNMPYKLQELRWMIVRADVITRSNVRVSSIDEVIGVDTSWDVISRLMIGIDQALDITIIASERFSSSLAKYKNSFEDIKLREFVAIELIDSTEWIVSSHDYKLVDACLKYVDNHNRP